MVLNRGSSMGSEKLESGTGTERATLTVGFSGAPTTVPDRLDPLLVISKREMDPQRGNETMIEQ